MNIPTKIILHSSDVSEKTLFDQYNSINNYHKSLGFDRSILGNYVGYHVLITGGKTYKCKNDDEIGSHCNNIAPDGRSINLQSLGVCVGFDGDIEYMSSDHFKLLKKQVSAWQDKYNIPDSEVYFHREWNSAKTCPGSLLTEEWKKALLARPILAEKPVSQCEKQEAIIAAQNDIISKLYVIMKSWASKFNS